MRLCTVEDCEKKHYGKGMCQAHYLLSIKDLPHQSGRVCDIPGCGRKHEGHGLCRLHYRRTEAQREADRRRTKEKPPRKRNNAQWIKIQSDPVKSALRKAEKRLAYIADPDRVKNNVRWHNTGFTRDMLDAQHSAQGGCCAICAVLMKRGGRDPDSECCDHEEQVSGVRVKHKTEGAAKVPRGLLCGACNKALGIYENHQRPRGLIIPQYETYILSPPMLQTLTKTG